MKCVVCQEQAVTCYSIDIDVSGIGACEKHADHVGTAYIALLWSGEDMFWKLIKGHKDYIKVKK